MRDIFNKVDKQCEFYVNGRCDADKDKRCCSLNYCRLHEKFRVPNYLKPKVSENE